MKQQTDGIAYITVLGTDQVGIIATISSELAKQSVNILEVTQTVMNDVFTMTMRVDTHKSSLSIADLATRLDKLGEKNGLQIHVHDAAIIRAMHRL